MLENAYNHAEANRNAYRVPHNFSDVFALIKQVVQIKSKFQSIDRKVLWSDHCQIPENMDEFRAFV